MTVATPTPTTMQHAAFEILVLLGPGHPNQDVILQKLQAAIEKRSQAASVQAGAPEPPEPAELSMDSAMIEARYPLQTGRLRFIAPSEAARRRPSGKTPAGFHQQFPDAARIRKV